MICLLAEGREWPAKRLSEELQVTVRTVHRDMKLLEAKGLAMRTNGRKGAYRLIQETAWERPQLTLREVITLLILAGRQADSEPPIEPEPAFSAVTKLIQFQPSAARQRLEALANLMSRSPNVAAGHWLCSQSWLAVVLEGLIETRPLQLWLREPSGQVAAAPIALVPSSLEFCEGQWLLRSLRVSPEGGMLSLELECVAAAEFDGESG